MSSKILMVSGDTDGKVHIREWRVKQKGTVDYGEEFLNMLDHYDSNGHYVAMGFRRHLPDFPPDETLIHAIKITGTFQVVA